MQADLTTNIDPATEETIRAGRNTAYLEARRQGLNHHDAEDTAAIVAAKLWQLIVLGNPPKSVSAWARKACANQVIDAHRKRNRLKNGHGVLDTCVSIDDLNV